MHIVRKSKLLYQNMTTSVFITPAQTILKQVSKQLNYRMEEYCIKKFDSTVTPNSLNIIDEEYYIYFEMDYLKGGDLMNYIQLRNYKPYFDNGLVLPEQSNSNTFTEKNKVILKLMINLLTKLRDESIIHLDVKPENFVFTDKTHTELRIIDFGSAQTYNFETKDSFTLSQIIGTPFYIPPEYYLDNTIHYNSDIWSLGITLLVLETGKNIFDKNTNYELALLENQQDLDDTIDKYIKVDTDSNNLIKNMLKLDCSIRFDYDDILTHSYLN